MNPYVANSFGGWAVRHRLPIQGSPLEAASAGTSSFGMSGVNAHAIISPSEAAHGGAAEGGAALAAAPWQRSLRCFVDVLVPLHPLLGTAVKVRGRRLLCMPTTLPNRLNRRRDLQQQYHARALHLSGHHPLAYGVFPPPVQAKQQLQFRLSLSRPVLAFLWDHQVQASAIMPGAAYFEMAAAAGRTLLRMAEPAVALKGAVIAAPLRLPAALDAGSVVVTADVALLSGDLSIRSASASAGGSNKSKRGRPGSKPAPPPETLHLRGSLAAVSFSAAAAFPASVDTSTAVSADATRAACPTPMDAAAVYRGLHAAGLQYGPAFRRLHGIQQGSGGASAGLRGSSSCQDQSDADVAGFLMHPAALDSCLQLGALVPEAPGGEAGAQQQGAFVPAGLAAFLIQRLLRQGSGVQALVRRSPVAARRTPGATCRDHRLLSASGAVLAVLDGLEAKQLPGGSATAGSLAASKKQSQPEVLYEVAWQAAALAGSDAAAAAGTHGSLELALPRGGAVPLQAVSGGLLALQGALQHQAAAVRLDTLDDAPAGLAATQAAGGNALWGMLRAFAAEAPTVVHGGARADPAAVGSLGIGKLQLHGHTDSAASDGYGSRLRAGAALHAVLLPSSTVRPAAGPFHLMPRPRGAFRCGS